MKAIAILERRGFEVSVLCGGPRTIGGVELDVDMIWRAAPIYGAAEAIAFQTAIGSFRPRMIVRSNP